MIFSLKLQGRFGDKGKSTKQVALKTIMNTRIQDILEILPDSFRIRRTPNKGSSRKGMREQTHGH